MTLTDGIYLGFLVALMTVYAVYLGLIAYKESQPEIEARIFLAQIDSLVDAEMENRA